MIVVADLQNLAATATGYYDHSNQIHQTNGGYGQPHGAHNGYYQPQPQQQAFHGAPVYYGVTHGGDIGQHAAYDNRKRGYDALNDFFGDAKRRQIDPASYPQVGQRLMALHGIPIHGGSIVDYMPSAPAMVSVGGHGHAPGPSMPQPHYALPMPNLRTKSDLLNIDNFLDQMQSTVYESSNQAAAAGVHQPGAHYTHQSLGFRQSHSPPTASQHLMGSMGSHSSHTAPLMTATSSHSPQSGTPALTPPSSMSYTSGHSPTSVPGLSPSSRHSSAASTTYPTLPAVSSGYGGHSNAAPVSTLGTNFDNDPRRRFSGGMLQKSAMPRTDEMDVSEEATQSPKENTPRGSFSDIITTEVSGSVIDPALSDVSSPSQSSDSGETARDKAQEIWVENIRVIEALRKFVSDRLEKHEYVEDEDVEMSDDTRNGENTPTETPLTDEASSTQNEECLYPVLNPAIDA